MVEGNRPDLILSEAAQAGDRCNKALQTALLRLTNPPESPTVSEAGQGLAVPHLMARCNTCAGSGHDPGGMGRQDATRKGQATRGLPGSRERAAGHAHRTAGPVRAGAA